MTFEDLGFSKVDLDREERTGVPEVIFGMGKTSEQVQEIFARLASHHGRVLVTELLRRWPSSSASNIRMQNSDQTRA